MNIIITYIFQNLRIHNPELEFPSFLGIVPVPFPNSKSLPLRWSDEAPQIVQWTIRLTSGWQPYGQSGEHPADIQQRTSGGHLASFWRIQLRGSDLGTGRDLGVVVGILALIRFSCVETVVNREWIGSQTGSQTLLLTKILNKILNV